MGIGLMLEHRLAEPVSFPKRIGWFLGWRFAVALHESDPATVRRATTCNIIQPMADSSFVDRSMLFQAEPGVHLVSARSSSVVVALQVAEVEACGVRQAERSDVSVAIVA